jgi:methionyl-tRNA synthetase
MHLCN